MFLFEKALGKVKRTQLDCAALRMTMLCVFIRNVAAVFLSGLGKFRFVFTCLFSDGSRNYKTESAKEENFQGGYVARHYVVLALCSDPKVCFVVGLRCPLFQALFSLVQSTILL